MLMPAPVSPLFARPGSWRIQLFSHPRALTSGYAPLLATYQAGSHVRGRFRGRGIAKVSD
jgi:hypothetical protein